MRNEIVAIKTIQTFNYGNRLQNFAVQEIIRKSGFNVETISSEENLSLANRMKWWIKRTLFSDKRANFHRFNKRIAFSKSIFNTNQITNCYAIVVGSDQVWNTTFKVVDDTFFLPYVHPRKISFSASFGVDSIPYDQKTVDFLNDFKALSVREEAGAKIIKDLTGRDATVLVDPTMLLTQEEWRKVSKKPRGAKEGYILTYFLSPKCDEAKTKLEDVREDKEVYELLNPNDKVAGTAGPSEFLWLFEHADLILTDSFHACVFSFLFNKPFIVYDRNWNEGNMNSRLETLLSKFSLKRKYANSGLPNDIWEHDYTEGYKQLEIERKKAINFLKKALED